MKPYICAVCGRKEVKLWRPYGDTEPLICAKCAEKRQTKEWKVDESGRIPSEGTQTTDILVVSISDISKEYQYASGNTKMVPAVKDSDQANYLAYDSFCKEPEMYKLWEELPT